MRVFLFGCYILIQCYGEKKSGFSGRTSGKESTCGEGHHTGLISGSGRSLGEGNGYLLQYSCLENPMNRGAWRVTVHRVTKSQTRLKRHGMHTHAVRAKTDFAGRLYQMPALLAWSLLPAPQWQHFLLPLHCFPSSFRLLPFFVPSLIQLCFATQIQHILHSKCGRNPRKAALLPQRAPMWPSPSCKFFAGISNG